MLSRLREMFTARFPVLSISWREDGKRLIEMEKYKLDLVELRDSIHNKLTNTLDYNKLRPAVVLPEHFYSPSIAREPLPSHARDIPTFDKYTLTQEAKDALKTPEFDVWQWEHNEVTYLTLSQVMNLHF